MRYLSLFLFIAIICAVSCVENGKEIQPKEVQHTKEQKAETGTQKIILNDIKPTLAGYNNNAFVETDKKHMTIFRRDINTDAPLVAAKGGNIWGEEVGFQIGKQGEKILSGDAHIEIDGDTQFTGNLDYDGSTYTFLGTVKLLKHVFSSDDKEPLVFNLVKDKGFVYVKGKGKITLPDGKSLIIPRTDEQARSGYETRVLGIEWVKISSGSFSMGSTDARPVHSVYLDSYYISTTEVTFAQYDKFCEDTGRSKPKDRGWGRGNRPVLSVSWNDADAFCKWLSKKTGKNIHLPTEAQWEKACRAGSSGKRYGSLDSIAWYRSNSNKKTHPVGQKQPNSYGLYDMLGNVWEWCQDCYDGNYYSRSPRNNPKGPSSGDPRVLRGGCWDDEADYVRSDFRNAFGPSTRGDSIGFRLAQNSVE